MDHLDSTLLRTFIAVVETGSMSEAAARIHRTQSATSLQIKRLEQTLGRPVFVRHGRGVRLTRAGEALLPVARDVTARLDVALRDFTAQDLGGHLRIGLPDDHSQIRLAKIVAEFAMAYPQVELEVTCALSARFPEALKKGDLDLAVYEVETPGPGETPLMRDETCWAMADGADLLALDPVPVALFDRDCWWRDIALASLQNSDRNWRVIYSSQSVAGVTAAVQAGVAIGLLGRATLPAGLQALGRSENFEPTPPSCLVLATSAAQDTPARAGMVGTICREFAISAAR